MLQSPPRTLWVAIMSLCSKEMVRGKKIAYRCCGCRIFPTTELSWSWNHKIYVLLVDAKARKLMSALLLKMKWNLDFLFYLILMCCPAWVSCPERGQEWGRQLLSSKGEVPWWWWAGCWRAGSLQSAGPSWRRRSRSPPCVRTIFIKVTLL